MTDDVTIAFQIFQIIDKNDDNDFVLEIVSESSHSLSSLIITITC